MRYLSIRWVLSATSTVALFAGAVLLGGLLVSRAGDGQETELPKTPVPVHQGQPPSIPTVPPLGEISFPTAEEAAANLPPEIREAAQAILEGSADEFAAFIAWEERSCSEFGGPRGGLGPSCTREGLPDGTIIRAIPTSLYITVISSEREFGAMLEVLLTGNPLRLDLVAQEADGSYLLVFHLEEARTLPEEFFRGDSPFEWLYAWLAPGEGPPIVMFAPAGNSPDPVRFWLEGHQGRYTGILGVSEELKAVDESYREEFQRAVEAMRPTVEAAWTASAENQ